jgi:hypothetical protein
MPPEKYGVAGERNNSDDLEIGFYFFLPKILNFQNFNFVLD